MSAIPTRTPRQRRWLWLLALLVAASALWATALNAPRAEARALVTGVTNLYSTQPLSFQRTKETGSQLVRIQLYWGGVAPRTEPVAWNPANHADPNYNWGEADEAVLGAVAAGLTPVLQFDGAPLWAQRCATPPSLAGAICDPDPADLRPFAQAAAERYSGRVAGVPAVKYFQALNEPNLSLFFLPQYETNGAMVSPELYRALVNATYAGVKTAEPNALVMLAGLGPIAVPKYTIGPIAFAKALLCMTGSNKKPKPLPGDCGGGVNFDIFAMQPYSTGGPRHEGGPNDVQIGDLPKLQTLIKAADKANRINSVYKRTPLWVTEFSWDSNPPDPGGLPMRIETRWVAEALHTAWSAGVQNFFWFSLRDDEHNPGEPYSQSLESGLYFRGASLEQDAPKPFLKSFRFPFVAYPGPKFEFWGRTPTSRAGKVKIQLKVNGKWTTARTVRADKDGIFRGKFDSKYGRDKKGTARAVYGKQKTANFAMKPVPDFYHPPFG
ncbi:MAG: hypothetical protein QOE75_882 [Solirubrobacterales bacterium]|nr:hypothetical protein [Solirubrobacterales bacterium]